MATAYLPLAAWPIQDREAWQEAVEDGDIFDGRGRAFHWGAATRKLNIVQYGHWLAFLRSQNLLDALAFPANRVTPRAVHEYLTQMKVQFAPWTVVIRLVGLKLMMKVMAPEQDWRWLADICDKLSRNAKPIRDKRSRMFSSGKIYRTAIKRLEKLSKTNLTKRVDILGFRNALMLALMTAVPLRLKNFFSLTIGKSFLEVDSGWLIRVPASEVKNKQHLEFDVPTSLLPHIKCYFERVRPRLAKQDENALWIAWSGNRLGYSTVHQTFTKFTKQLLGKSINPHLLRDCAATTMASISLNAAMAARGLLGHRNFKTTEKYYIHAMQLEASRKINSLLETTIRECERRK